MADRPRVTEEQLDEAAQAVIPALNRAAERSVYKNPTPVATCKYGGCVRPATKLLSVRYADDDLRTVKLCRTHKREFLEHFHRSGRLARHEGQEIVDLR